MPNITFSGVTKTIEIGHDGPITEVTAEYIYSRWKDWVANGNAQYQPAFAESVGGNELGGGTSLAGYFFVRNDLGWRLTHANYDYEIRISGDIYPADPNTPFIIPGTATHSVQFVFQRSAASYVVVGSGTAAPTAAQVAAAVWASPSVVYVPSSEENAEAVWDKPMSEHSGQGTFGKRLKEILPTLWGIK